MGNYNRKTRKKVGGVRPSELRKAKKIEKEIVDSIQLTEAPMSSLGTKIKDKMPKLDKKHSKKLIEPIVVQGFPAEESSYNSNKVIATAVGVPMEDVAVVGRINNKNYEDFMEVVGPLPAPPAKAVKKPDIPVMPLSAVTSKSRVSNVMPPAPPSTSKPRVSNIMPPPPPSTSKSPVPPSKPSTLTKPGTTLKSSRSVRPSAPGALSSTPVLYEDVLYITFIKSILEETLDLKTDIDKIQKYFEKPFIYDKINKIFLKEVLTVNMKILKTYKKDEVQPFEPENIGQITIHWKPTKGESIFEKCTPLLIAAKFGLTRMCKIIIDAVKSTEKQKKMLLQGDFWGNTPLSLCARYGYKSLCNYFIEKHTELNINLEGYLWPQETYSTIQDIDTPPAMYGDCFGKTPLMISSEKGHMEIVEILLKQGANPLAKNDINQSALHHCVMKCCPTATNYKTPYGIIKTNTNEYYQYYLAHNDKYKLMTKVWRFNRIIHLLLRFIIFENGNFSEKKYRKDGLKLALENDDHSTNMANDWNPLTNNGNGAFSRYSVQNNSNWMGYYQTRKSSLNVNRSLTFQQIAEISNYTEVYRSAFIKKNKKNKLYTSGTYETGDYTIIQNVFTQDSRVCPFIAGNPNMFLELEKGFDRSVWTAAGSKDFIHYFLKYLFFEEHVPHRSENDRIQEALLFQRQLYMLQLGHRSLKNFNPVQSNKTKKKP